MPVDGPCPLQAASERLSSLTAALLEQHAHPLLGKPIAAGAAPARPREGHHRRSSSGSSSDTVRIPAERLPPDSGGELEAAASGLLDLKAGRPSLMGPQPLKRKRSPASAGERALMAGCSRPGWLWAGCMRAVRG